ncbi:hypothetical protein EV702DRAFT_1051309 [Suillus placidus]|uniref:Uncharacterized protein n=1 Tax=Suillus placidus TaxID=48579 RepID=A0A9P6ZGU8_9AGAM|nr:hypothetical protein EV702DRAFT_1051309 [Suillus placidus]
MNSDEDIDKHIELRKMLSEIKGQLGMMSVWVLHIYNETQEELLVSMICNMENANYEGEEAAAVKVFEALLDKQANEKSVDSKLMKIFKNCYSGDGCGDGHKWIECIYVLKTNEIHDNFPTYYKVSKLLEVFEGEEDEAADMTEKSFSAYEGVLGTSMVNYLGAIPTYWDKILACAIVWLMPIMNKHRDGQGLERFISVKEGYSKEIYKEHMIQVVWSMLWDGQTNTVLQMHNNMSSPEMKVGGVETVNKGYGNAPVQGGQEAHGSRTSGNSNIIADHSRNEATQYQSMKKHVPQDAKLSIEDLMLEREITSEYCARVLADLMHREMRLKHYSQTHQANQGVGIDMSDDALPSVQPTGTAHLKSTLDANIELYNGIDQIDLGVSSPLSSPPDYESLVDNTQSTDHGPPQQWGCMSGTVEHMIAFVTATLNGYNTEYPGGLVTDMTPGCLQSLLAGGLHFISVIVSDTPTISDEPTTLDPTPADPQSVEDMITMVINIDTLTPETLSLDPKPLADAIPEVSALDYADIWDIDIRVFDYEPEASLCHQDTSDKFLYASTVILQLEARTPAPTSPTPATPVPASPTPNKPNAPAFPNPDTPAPPKKTQKSEKPRQEERIWKLHKETKSDGTPVGNKFRSDTQTTHIGHWTLDIGHWTPAFADFMNKYENGRKRC